MTERTRSSIALGRAGRLPAARRPADGPVARNGSTALASPAFRWVAYSAVAWTYLLIIMGAIVRASGSGLGCPDWPLCYGQVVPPGQIPSIIEYSHRFLGLIASGFILATCILWARTHNWSPRVVAGGATVGVLLLAQIILGAVTVKLELPPYVVLVHLGMAEILLGMLIFVAAHASPAPRLVGAAPNRRFRNLAVGGMAAVYLLVLTGANVRANEASWACAGFPLCSGQFAPFGIDRLMDIQLLHRFFAYLVAAHLLVVVARAWRRERGTPALRTAAGFVLAALLAQIGIGAGMVSMGVPMVAQVLHVAGASAVWATIVGLTAIVWRARQSAGEAG